VQGRAVLSIKSISVEKQTQPIGASNERMRPRRVHAAAVIVLFLSFNTSTAARAQQTNDCKLFREYQQACVKNHTRDACNNEYSICMKYCRKK
jgi:hypothetical protein